MIEIFKIICLALAALYFAIFAVMVSELLIRQKRQKKTQIGDELSRQTDESIWESLHDKRGKDDAN